MEGQNQKPDRNKYDTRNNWTNVLSLIIEKAICFFSPKSINFFNNVIVFRQIRILL